LYYGSRQLNSLRLELTKLGDKKNPKTPFLYDKNDVSKISVIDENTGVVFDVPCLDPRVLPGMSLAEFNHQYRSGITATKTKVFTKSNWVVSEAEKRKREEIMLKKQQKAALAKKKREDKKKQTSEQVEQTSDITERATEHVKAESTRHARNHTGKMKKTDPGLILSRPLTRPVTKSTKPPQTK
jgi:hypothetical protein